MWRRWSFNDSMWAVIIVLALSVPAVAQTEAPDAHVSLEDPLEMTPDEARKAYQALKERMAAGFGISDYPPAKDYQNWEVYNTAPYISATHGQRYVNNYANELGKDYGKLEPGGKYPQGTVFAKDSISAVDKDHIFPGAIFFMEKLAKGASPETADWRYVMVLPLGALYGDTKGDKARNVRYCHACHIQKADDDFVFFVPENWRQ